MTIEDEGSTFLDNIRNHLPSETKPHPRRSDHQDVIIDHEKAYDSLDQETQWPILTEENVPSQIIKATQHLCYN